MIPGMAAEARDSKVVVVLEINVALWIMIACFAIRASELIQFSS
jgi:hypothetical protein